MAFKIRVTISGGAEGSQLAGLWNSNHFTVLQPTVGEANMLERGTTKFTYSTTWIWFSNSSNGREHAETLNIS